MTHATRSLRKSLEPRRKRPQCSIPDTKWVYDASKFDEDKYGWA